jgi:ribonuclease BN (tRNA processing enzyme)
LIDHIIITHPHADHYLGLDDLSSLRRISGLSVLPIYMLSDGWPLVQRAFRHLIAAEVNEHDKRPFARRQMCLGQPLELHDGLRVTPLDSHHTQPFTTAGLLFEREDKTVFYASDFYNVDVDRLVGADLVILDGSFLTREHMNSRYSPRLEEGMGRHLPLVEEVAWARSIGARRVIITHLGHLQMSTSEILAYLDDDLCSLAYDGLTVTT